jgi:hypothetical protein
MSIEKKAADLLFAAFPDQSRVEKARKFYSLRRTTPTPDSLLYDAAILAISRLLPLETDIANPVEAAIALRLIDAGIAAGYSISVYEGEGWALERSTDRKTIMKALASTCMDRLYFFTDDGVRLGWVLLVYGNGEDLISDNIVCDEIEALLKVAQPEEVD